MHAVNPNPPVSPSLLHALQGCLEAVGMKLPHLDRPDRIDMRAATARLHRALSAHPTPAVRSHYVVQQLQALLAKQY